jgi:hypothetical protein
VDGVIVMSYFLLLFYTYALIGPWPILRLDVYFYFGGVWCGIMFLMYVLGRVCAVVLRY